MIYRLEKKENKIIFVCDEELYELRSHPYEPCLYIYKNNEMIKILHNAFDVYDLPAKFEAGESVMGINGKYYDQELFCKVLSVAINDRHYEMDWPYAANLVK